jgi:hypothetical protein
MAACDETLLAAAAVVQGLAKDIPPSPLPSFNNNHKPGQAANGCDVAKIKLPGDESDGKAALERELAALISRVSTMQSFVVSFLDVVPVLPTPTQQNTDWFKCSHPPVAPPIVFQACNETVRIPSSPRN